MSSKKKSVKELPLSVIPKELRNGQMAPVFKLIVTDHSTEDGRKGKKHKGKKLSSSAEVGLYTYIIHLKGIKEV